MNILIISSNLIGDSILSSGIIKYFIDQNVNSKLTIVVGPSAAQVYKNFPNLKKIIIINKRKFKLHWFGIWIKCFFSKWDLIVDLRSSFVSHFLLKKSSFIFKHSKDSHQIHQLTDFFKLKNVAHPIIFNSEAEEKNARNRLLSDKKYIVVSPGGNWFPKIWPVENFNRLLRILFNLNKNLIIILVGSDYDVKFRKDLTKNIDNRAIIDLMGENVTQTHSFMKRSNLFIGNDSGLMHLSAAANIPTIGLFGPTNDIIYSPFGEKCSIIRTNETYEDFSRINIDINKSYMHSIKVEDVVDIIKNKNLI